MSVPLVILSDVRLFREALALDIARLDRDIEVVGVGASAREGLEIVSQHPQAIVLVDAGIRSAAGEMRRIAQRAPEATLLALALAPETESEIVSSAEAGIAGYIVPEASVEELAEVVEHAARGEMLCTPRVAGALARRMASLATQEPTPVRTRSLTTRELEVLDLVEAGLSNKQIALRLSIRVATVKNHVHSILAKLKVRRRGEAVAAYRAEGMARGREGQPSSRPPGKGAGGPGGSRISSASRSAGRIGR